MAVATLDREPAATAGASTVSFVGADDDLRYSPWFVARAQLPREGDECGCCDGFEGEHALAAVAVTSVVCDGVAVLCFTMLYNDWCLSEDGSGVCVGHGQHAERGERAECAIGAPVRRCVDTRRYASADV